MSSPKRPLVLAPELEAAIAAIQWDKEEEEVKTGGPVDIVAPTPVASLTPLNKRFLLYGLETQFAPNIPEELKAFAHYLAPAEGTIKVQPLFDRATVLAEMKVFFTPEAKANPGTLWLMIRAGMDKQGGWQMSLDAPAGPTITPHDVLSLWSGSSAFRAGFRLGILVVANFSGMWVKQAAALQCKQVVIQSSTREDYTNFAGPWTNLWVACFKADQEAENRATFIKRTAGFPMAYHSDGQISTGKLVNLREI